MRTLKCEYCGAPVQLEDNATIHTCSFCKASFQVAPLVAAPPPVEIHIHRLEAQHPLATPARARRSSSVFRTLFPIVLILGIFIVIELSSGGRFPISFAGLWGWDGKLPISCSGNDNVSVKNVTAIFSVGSAITVEGNCRFECENCTITAPVVATVRGNGQIVFINGRLEGSETVAHVSGNGIFEVRGNTQVYGAKPISSANGRIIGLPVY